MSHLGTKKIVSILTKYYFNGDYMEEMTHELKLKMRQQQNYENNSSDYTEFFFNYEKKNIICYLYV